MWSRVVFTDTPEIVRKGGGEGGRSWDALAEAMGEASPWLFFT